jgi:hypothetical protein
LSYPETPKFFGPVATNSSDPNRITKKEAEQLSRVLVDKLAQRVSLLSWESAIAVGLVAIPPSVVYPPPWALGAAKIASAWLAKLFDAKPGQGAARPDQLGALVGLAETWEAFLKTPSPETIALEKKSDAVALLRKRVAEIAAPDIAFAKKLGTKTKDSPATGLAKLQFAKGQLLGSAAILNEAGELKSESSTRDEICFFIWLYWPDLGALESIADLQKFFDEYKTPVSRKNLEKVCAEIGLRFRGRGRPKKPTSANKPVGIKKSKTGVKRGHDNSRRRKKKSG